MLSKLSAVLLVLVLAFPACLWAKPVSKVDSIQPIQYAGETFCTAFSINEQKGLWASAKHCADIANEVKELYGSFVTIGGVPAAVVFMDSLDDVAVFEVAFKAPALKLAKRAVAVCDPFQASDCEPIATVGHPYGVTKVVTVGFVGARDVILLHPTLNVPVKNDVLDLTVAGGNSGGPVLNKDGEVTGILWGMFVGSGHSLSVPLDSVKRLLSKFMETGKG